jgi:hypothetical protein
MRYVIALFALLLAGCPVDESARDCAGLDVWWVSDHDPETGTETGGIWTVQIASDSYSVGELALWFEVGDEVFDDLDVMEWDLDGLFILWGPVMPTPGEYRIHAVVQTPGGCTDSAPATLHVIEQGST